MKIALINGSPKVRRSASDSILQDLRPLLKGKDRSIYQVHMKRPLLEENDLLTLSQCDCLVFAFPLYVDGIPSHLLNCLVQLEKAWSEAKKEIRVYVIVNCSFYEGHQNKLAIAMMEAWCERAGLEWGQGLGIGAGGTIAAVRSLPLNQGPKKNMAWALNRLAKNVECATRAENEFITMNFPRFAYKLVAEMNWWLSVRANGLKRRDLSRKI